MNQFKQDTPFRVFEMGMAWDPSGFADYTVYWSDGTVTVEKRWVGPGLMDIRLQMPILRF